MHRFGRFVLALVFAGSGYGCFLSLEELGPRRPSGSAFGVDPSDAGEDGGASDAGLQCSVADDCPWVPLDAGFPYFQCPSSEGMSCLDGRCVFECNSGRACRTDAGSHCLSCERPVEKTECGPTACSALYNCQMHIGYSTCAQGPLAGEVFEVARQPDCSWRLARPDGGPVVGIYWDLDHGRSFGTFPGNEGTCTGLDLFTGLPRMQWTCPGGCSFVEVGCD